MSWTTVRSSEVLSPIRTLAPEDAVGADDGVGPDVAVVADDGRAPDLGRGVHLRPLAQPDPGPQREPLTWTVDLLVEDVLVGRHIGLEGAHVLPVALGHAAEEGLAGLQDGGEDLLGEVHRPARGDEIEDLGLEDVDPGVDGVAEDLAPGGLLQEPLDRPVLVGDDDPELERILHRLQGDGGQRPVGLVEVDHRGQVDVGEDVAGDDHEALVELVPGVQDRPGRPQRGGLGGVDHPHPELRPSPK